jgi:hypothetical protein
METAISKVYPVAESLSVLQPPDDESENEQSFIWRDLTSITPTAQEGFRLKIKTMYILENIKSC